MTSTDPLGILGFDRLALIPKRFRAKHEFCFHLHDQIATLLVQYEQTGAHNWVQEAFEKAIEDSGTPLDGIDLLTFLKNEGLVQHYEHHITAHLVLGLTSDMLHFVYEALSAFEKRKFAVGFSLLRKPLKENLLFLCWLLSDRADFIQRFERDNYTTLNDIKPEKRIKILTEAINCLPVSEAFIADLLNDIIFSKSSPNGLEPIWQRATHLITKQGELLRTEDLSINFIFHDYADDSHFERLYVSLPYVMYFAVQVALECFAQILESNALSVSHLIISTTAAYECLFEKGRKSNGVVALLQHTLRPFLKCIHCDSKIRLTKANALGMCLHEQVVCSSCNLVSPLPLYWLLAQANVKIDRDQARRPILAGSAAPGDRSLH